MDCPACHNSVLSPVKLDQDLPAYGCQQCGGALVSLLYYRDWSERTTYGDNTSGNASDLAPAVETLGGDSHGALTCPKCKRLMTKYLVSGDSKNRIDLCSACDEAWLDGGEWEWLKALHLDKKLSSVFTDSWQRRVKTEVIEQKHRERFARIVGEDNIQKAEEIRTWLKGHQFRQEILFYISR